MAVIQLYFVGDTLLATPAIRALRRRFPSAALEVVVKRRSAAVLECNPHVDRLTLYDPASLWQRPAHLWGLTRRWRREGVDLVVDLTADRRSEGLMRRMRARRRVGFHPPGRLPQVDSGLPKACGDAHVADHMLALVALVGATGDAALEYVVPAAERARAEAWKAGLGRRAVALHAGGNSMLRRWKLPRFVELARALRHRGYAVWAVGAAAERDLGEALARAGAEDLTGRLSVAATAAHLMASDLLVANDSAPMHFAGAVGTPTLGLFGPSLPHNVAPRGPGHECLHVRLECCPCDQKRCVRPGDFCLDRLAVADVLARAEALLARPRTGADSGAGR